MQYYDFSSHINICFVCIVIIIIIVLDILSYFHIAHLTTEIKYKIAQSTSFMLCMSYRYINKSSPLFLSHPLIICYFGVMAVSFIGGGNRSTRRKSQTCSKSLTNFIAYSCIEYISSRTGFEITTYVVIGTDWMGTCKSNYYAITTTAAPTKYLSKIYP